MKQSGYPHGRPGYVVDHIVPLANGGSDSPSNMQWQTKADAKAKDKWERGEKPSGKRKR
ncbi:MAG: HNH endonuclease signature motif containing protein [Bacteroidota bacterium]|nr:HNH endonuclease signature motif containing protein [Bacteroidota bacterium]